MAVKQRARKDEDKAARRRAILTVAARLLGRKQYHRITMAEVARRCHLAKGTLYLYFRSKEELFLAALEDELAQWFDALGEQLAALASGSADAPERFAATVARSLVERETLTDLLPLLHTVLEQNIDEDTAAAFKQMLLRKVGEGATAVHLALPGLAPGDGVRVLMRLHALVVGLRQMADPAPVVAQVLARPQMEPLRVEFEEELRGSLAAMVRGMLPLQVVSSVA
ncbi:MAG: TetR family transcriptional regulator [Myxococcales bacterium]|nr:TetR family transcriptional regulator [Myxococcales bacterium]MCB9713469.1 TetR family transcriptional regulator [Myxococcales bacterium]